MDNNKKPSRKHDWTPQELQLIALCIQCAALAIQLARVSALESCGFVVVNGKVCMKYVKT